jgi:hypothetical protein
LGCGYIGGGIAYENAFGPNAVFLSHRGLRRAATQKLRNPLQAITEDLRPGFCVVAEAAESEILSQACGFDLLPPDALQVSGDDAQQLCTLP